MKNQKWIAQAIAFSFLAIFISVWSWYLLSNICKNIEICSGFQEHEIFWSLLTLLSLGAGIFLYVIQQKPKPLYSDRRNFVKGAFYITLALIIDHFLTLWISKYGTQISLYFYPSSSEPSFSALNRIQDESNLRSNAYWYLAYTVLLAPVKEEIFHRGLIFGKWAERVGQYKSVIIAALFFALAHYSDKSSLQNFMFVGLPSFFVSGVLLGLLRVRFTIYHAVVMHVLSNGLVMWARLWLM